MSPRIFGPLGPSLGELWEEALTSTERGYDHLAPKFDHTPFRTPDEVVSATLADVGEVDDALDLCCGTGVGLLALLPGVRRRLVGLDLSGGMLVQARTRLGTAGSDDRPRIELVKGDVLLQHVAGTFDLVTCFGAFGHIPEAKERAFVQRVRGWLRPGGRFVFVTSEAPPPLSRSYVLARAFNAAMRLRNAVLDPPFVMYYLTFLLPDVARLLRWEGFEVTVDALPGVTPPFDRLKRVVATRRPA